MRGWLGKRQRGGGENAPRNDIKHVTWMVAIAVGLGQLIAAVFRREFTLRHDDSVYVDSGSEPPAGHRVFLSGQHTDNAGRRRNYKIFEAFHHKTGAVQAENWKMVIIATLVAAVVSFIAVKWLLQYVQTHTFVAFGWYRIILGGAILWFVIQVGTQPSLDHGQIHSFAPVIIQHLVPVQFAHAKIL